MRSSNSQTNLAALIQEPGIPSGMFQHKNEIQSEYFFIENDEAKTEALPIFDKHSWHTDTGKAIDFYFQQGRTLNLGILMKEIQRFGIKGPHYYFETDSDLAAFKAAILPNKKLYKGSHCYIYNEMVAPLFKKYYYHTVDNKRIDFEILAGHPLNLKQIAEDVKNGKNKGSYYWFNTTSAAMLFREDILKREKLSKGPSVRFQPLCIDEEVEGDSELEENTPHTVGRFSISAIDTTNPATPSTSSNQTTPSPITTGMFSQAIKAISPTADATNTPTAEVSCHGMS